LHESSSDRALCCQNGRICTDLEFCAEWTNELDFAFQALNQLTKTPRGLCYGDLKFSCWFEPPRKDPRYERLLEELAPKD